MITPLSSAIEEAKLSFHTAYGQALNKISDETLDVQSLQSQSRHPKVMMAKNTESNWVWEQQKAAQNIHVYTNYSDVAATEKFFWDIRPFFWDTPRTLNMDNKGTRIRLLMYGLSCQAKWGDNDEEEPSRWNLKAAWKWDAWTKQAGRPRTDARKDFVKLSEAIFGVESDDPELQRQGKEYMANVVDFQHSNVNPGYVEKGDYSPRIPLPDE